MSAPRADDPGARRAAARLRQLGQRRDEDVRPLQVAQLADEEEVARVGRRDDRLELLRLEPVGDDGRRPDGRPDLGGVGVGLELADEDEGVGHPLEHALGGEIDAARRRFRVVVQAAAVGSVDAGYARTRCPQESADRPRVGAALGAVGMQDVGIE